MLDAFIIDRLQRERDRRDPELPSVRVGIPASEPESPGFERGEELDDPERGSTIIEDAF